MQLWVHSSHFESCLVAVAVPAKAPLVVRGGGTRALLLVGCTQGQGFRGGKRRAQHRERPLNASC